MKALEHRIWFVLLSLVISLALLAALWTAAGLPTTLSAGSVFIFAVLGLDRGISSLLAIGLVKFWPSLGIVS